MQFNLKTVAMVSAIMARATASPTTLYERSALVQRDPTPTTGYCPAANGFYFATSAGNYQLTCDTDINGGHDLPPGLIVNSVQSCAQACVNYQGSPQANCTASVYTGINYFSGNNCFLKHDPIITNAKSGVIALIPVVPAF